MTDYEIHDLALISAKYIIENNMSKYTNKPNSQALVSDLLLEYTKAKRQIHNNLPNLS